MAIGLASESGEILDNLKAHLAYGKPIDVPNILEEAGDALFFMTKLLATVGHTIDDARAANVAKLRVRFPNGFTEQSALNRDRVAERTAYETVHLGAAEAGPRGTEGPAQ